MVFKSLGEAFGYLVKTPLVWLIGLVTALILLLSYYVYEMVGLLTASSVFLVFIFMLPAVLAGTYGIIYENSTSFSVFKNYALKGYFRCLLPLLITGILAFVISQFIAYLLMLTGLSFASAAQFTMFIYVPIFFFCYFADISAVVNNLRVFESLKDSALRVLNNSLSVAGYYLVNILYMILAMILGSFVWAALATEPLLHMMNVTETELLSYSQEELMAFSQTFGQDIGMALFTDPSIIFATVVAGVFMAIVFLPLFVAYKACYFKKTSPFAFPDVTPEMMEPEGEYDEKGRWYKYK